MTPLKLCLLGIVALLTACATPRSASTISIPASYSARVDPSIALKSSDAAWWREFQDPTLNRLVEETALNNRDVRAALARVDIARAELGVKTAALLPAIEAVGAYRNDTTSYPSAIRQQLPDIRATQGGAQVSWEIDLFGRARAARRAARADALAAEDARRGALLIAISESAEQYFMLRGAEDQHRIVTELVRAERDTLHLTELRTARGRASEFDLDRARGELADTEALLPRLDALIDTTRYRISVLAGRVPGSGDDGLNETTASVTIPSIPVAQPVELLHRRPDLMAADAKLMASGFRQDEARVLQFPQLVVQALIGSQWTNVNALDIGRARFTNAAGALSLPLFEGGRIRAAIAAADASQREALADYEQTLLRALEDVEGALSRSANDGHRQKALQAAITARTAALSKAQSLYEAGEIDLLQLLDVERGLLASRLAGSVNQTDRLVDAIFVYKALGGGWEAFGSRPLASATLLHPPTTH